MELPLDDSVFQAKHIAVTGFDRATVFVAGQAPEDAKQKTSPEDVPLWDIFCTEQEGRRVTNFKVRLASASAPAIEGISRIRFGGLRASTYPDGARNIVTFTADTFALGEAPSARKPSRPPAEERKAA